MHEKIIENTFCCKKRKGEKSDGGRETPDRGCEAGGMKSQQKVPKGQMPREQGSPTFNL